MKKLTISLLFLSTLLASSQPSFAMKRDRAGRPGHTLDQACQLISSIVAAMKMLCANPPEVLENADSNQVTFVSRTGTHFTFTQTEVNALGLLSPTIGDMISDFGDSEIPSPLPLPQVSNQAFFLLGQMVRGNSDGLKRFLRELTPAQIKDLKEQAEYLDSQELLNLADYIENFGEEFQIPNRKLSNGKLWLDEVSHQGSRSTCGSHAVSGCLEYVHRRDRVMPPYLHMVSHFVHETKDSEGNPAFKSYSKGHGTKELMKFSRDFGVPRIPEGQKSAYSCELFPVGEKKYAFRNMVDVFAIGDSKKVEKLKQALVKFRHPIVLSMKTRCDGVNLFKACTFEFCSDEQHSVPPIPPKVAGTERVYGAHAVVVYGYSDKEGGFLIKNSWGTTWCTEGKAIIDYDYVECWAQDAYLGMGAKILNHAPFTYPVAYGEGDTQLVLKGLGAGLVTGAVGIAVPVLAAPAAVVALSTAATVAVGFTLGGASCLVARCYWYYLGTDEKYDLPVCKK